MLSIPGLHPDKVLKIHRELGIGSIEELEAAAQQNRLKPVKGLGWALQRKILQGIEIRRTSKGSRHIHRAAALLDAAKKNLARSNAGLTVIVLKTADQKSKLMRVVAPLGVLLPSGLGLKLDNVDVGRAGFVRCLPNGCVAEVVMDDKLLGQLRTAKTATFIIFETPEEGIGFPLSLNGIGEGYDKLP